MPAIILPGRWRKQPNFPVEIDYNNPLARGLELLVSWGTNGAYNLCRGPIAPTTNAATLNVATPAGLAANIAANGTIYDVLPQTVLTESSYLAFVDTVPAASRSSAISIAPASPAAGQQYLLLNCTTGYSSSSGSIAFGGSDGGSYSLSAWAGALIAGPQVYLGTQIGTSRTLYRSGSVIGTATGGGTLTATIAFYPVVHGLKGYTGYSPSGHAHILSGMWSRGLSSGESAEVTNNPWQLVKRPPQKIYFLPSAGGGGATGSFAVTDKVDTSAFAGAVPISGSFTGTDSPDTSALAGDVLIAGSFTGTDLVDTAAFAGSVASAGAPTLSNPLVVSVTATSATPRVTVTFA